MQRRLVSPSLLSAAVLAACLGIAGTGRTQGPPGGEMPPTAVEAAKPKIESLSETLSAVGTLRADEAVTVRPEVAGRIEAVLFDEGQKIAKGAPLFRLDPSLARADVAEAQANASNSDRELKRATELAGKKLIAPADVDTKRAQAKVDEAKLASTRTRLEKTELRAPFAGTVGLRKVSPGEYVNAGDALVDLVARDTLKFDFSLPEVYLGRFQPGQKITLGVDALGARKFDGEVYAVAPQVDLTTRSVTLRARVPNPDGVLHPGQFARVALEVGSKANALLVPEQALWPQGDKQFVYIIKDGKAELVQITTGLRKPGLVEVTSGITANDLVISAGQMKIGPGMKVQPVDGKPPGEAPSGAAPAAK
ncbi:efflux RND transporter periplasmic adaptor subunit [Tahibacter soli]|jgi:membrane fusion protein (multidrug efflux system)|uniref:Efflux RND transporter periplasmic adaptor subunit n=1 Tax=Tahibacter soli TaxID=2983605 RepID=A0A9X3YLK1_9GAMM|nr:efflux RND transporter periplasmic adaptor subunit [Tahibacter soli]MDC8013216.1 efflux RND transporter periplasmic adaptor subunit [Tahibacter soli]